MSEDIEEIVKQHEDSFNKIKEYFGVSCLFSIEDWTNRYWCQYPSNDLGFDDEDIDDFRYSESVTFIVTKEKYTLCHVRDCFGDNYWVLLDNNKRREIN